MRPADDHGAPSYAPDRPRTYVYRRSGEDCRICGTTIAHGVSSTGGTCSGARHVSSERVRI